MESFRSWEHSLFSLPEERIGFLRLHPFTEGMWSHDANFSAATILLQEENIEEALQFIDLALEANPDSVHAWCNKGVYHLMMNPPQLAEVEEAESKMRQLLKQAEPRKRAIVEYAYWLHEMNRSKEAKDQSLKLFEEVIMESGDVIIENHHMYMRILTISAKSSRENKNPNWLAMMAQKLIDQCVIVASARLPKYDLDMWMNLAEIQQYWFCEKALNAADLSALLRVTGSRQMSIQLCINKMLKIQEDNDIPIVSNFYARIGKFYLELGRRERNDNKRWQLLEKAKEIGERYKDVPSSRSELGPIICGQIFLQMWAMKYYEQHRSEVNQKYKRIYGSNKRIFDTDIWRFLTNEYYTKTADNSSSTSYIYLQQAKEHLLTCASQPSNFSQEYPRVKMLLGDPQNEIKDCYRQCVNSETKSEQVKALCHYGLYLEAIGKEETAKGCFEAAINVSTKQCDPPFTPHLASNGLQRLSQY